MGSIRRVPTRISRRQGIPALAAVIGVASAAAIVTSITSPATSLAAAHPIGGSRSAIVFPQRDFVSLDGYVGDTVVVHVKHDTRVYGDVPEIVSEQATAQTDTGLIEINHPGGKCWVGHTPDIRPGDTVTIHVVDGPDAGLVDEGTEAANVTAKRPVNPSPGVIEIHGTASDLPLAGGAPIPLAQLEQRLVAPGSAFDANGRRTLRAPGVGTAEGTFAYDAPGSLNWTARYSGLSADDVKLAMSAESRVLWLGNLAVPTATESTIYENGPLTLPGPAAPCAAPLESLPPPAGSELVPPSVPLNVIAVGDGVNNATITWDASTDNVGVTAYGIFRNGQNVATVSKPDGTAPAPTTYVNRNLPPGAYTWQVNALDEVGNVSDLSDPSHEVSAVARVDVNSFPVNDPPHLPVSIIVFPSRDFVSPSGFLADDLVTVQLLRRNAAGKTVVISSAAGIQPDAEGFAEVNHPGAACWDGVTPEMRTGDIVRTIAYNAGSVSDANPDGIRTIDETVVAGVTAYRPHVDTPATPGNNDGVVSIHGTALGHDGRPIPVDQLEQRMIATHGVGLWDANGRRALRASSVGADGVLTYDTVNNPMGINWTATYSGLDEADVARMSTSDTRIHWLGSSPLTLAEATIMENADGNPPGPAGPLCTSPLEAADVQAPSAPTGVTVQVNQNQVVISWTPSTDDWSVAGYRIYDGADPVANTGPAGGIALSPVAAGDHHYSVRAFDTASSRGAGGDIVAQLIAGFGNAYGNESAASDPVTATVTDVIPPSKPTGLTATVNDSTVTLHWNASSDNVGVVRYEVRRDGDLVGSSTTATYPDAGVAIGDHTYTVTAFDAGGLSATSDPVTAHVTAVADTEAPTAPTGVTASTNPDVHGRNIRVTWAAATDNVAVSGYVVHRAGFGAATPGPVVTTLNGSTLSYIDANLAAGTYTYSVVAKDSAGNESPVSLTAIGAVANDPPAAPHDLIAFPARDFISATGYVPLRSYTFSVLRGNAVAYSSGSWAADSTGTVEVNHPGGACWITNTPNLQPGDVVRITDDTTGVPEQTTIANVTAERPIAADASTVVIHGTAQDAAGQPLPIDQIEQRLIANRDSFEKNGRRTLRAGAGVDGTLTYDGPNTINWTATYSGLSAKDVIRAVGGTAADGTVFVGSESRGLWLGRAPLALVETTIYENGSGVTGGPATPNCTAPAEGPTPQASVTPTPGGNGVAFPAMAFVPVPASSAPQQVAISNGAGASPLRVSNVYVAGANPGDFRVTGGTCAAAPFTLNANQSCTVLVVFRPTALGLRQAYLAFADNAANTNDQAVALTGNGSDASDPKLSASPNPLAFGTRTAVPGGIKQSVRITNTGTGKAMSLSASTTSGDFSVPVGTTCNLAPGAFCDIEVTFKPSGTAARTGSLLLTHTALQGGATQTTIPLSGTGQGAVLTWGSNTLNFGTVKRGATANQTVSLKNSGNQVANLGTPSAARFVVTGAFVVNVVSTTCGATLNVNASCNVVVSYTAPNNAVNPPPTGTLTVNAANGMPTSVVASLVAAVK